MAIVQIYEIWALNIVLSFSAQDIAQLFLDHFFKFYGMPIIIVTDKDKVFISLFFSRHSYSRNLGLNC
jgi:hypothetical protein